MRRGVAFLLLCLALCGCGQVESYAGLGCHSVASVDRLDLYLGPWVDHVPSKGCLYYHQFHIHLN